MAVQIPAILAFIAAKGLQEAIKRYGRSAVSRATAKASRDATKRATKTKNKEVLKKLDEKKIEEKASENILKRQIEKEGIESVLTKETKAKVTRPISKGKTAEKNARKESWKSKDPAERRGPHASPRQAQKSRDTLKDKARQRRLEKERQERGDLDDAFIEEGERFPDKFITSEGDPIPLKFAEGGEANKGIEALRKVAPDVVKRMGYQQGGAMTDTNTWEKTSIEKKKRYGMQEGGDIEEQMNMLMPETEMMVEEPADQAMVSDEQMEDDYLDFVVEQALEPEEQELLMDVLDESPQLSVIFDKLMDVATEFSGAGPVIGPGSGVSDSIPARLSDGEFVFTAKATEQIGSDRLQSMMDDAESEADAMRQEMQMGGEVEEKPKVDEFGKPIDEDIAEDEIKKGMMSVNPRMQ